MLDQDDETYNDQDLTNEYMRTMMTLSDSGVNVEDGLYFDSTRNFLKTRETKIKNKNVDTKASKGRKVRYDVMEKLVGFVAPRDSNELPSRDEIVINLFGGLLGKKRRRSSDMGGDPGVGKRMKFDRADGYDIDIF